MLQICNALKYKEIVSIKTLNMAHMQHMSPHETLRKHQIINKVEEMENKHQSR